MQRKTPSERSRISRRGLERELSAAADSQRAEILQRFFKTGKGEYGEGDRFLGITVPLQRKIALRYHALPLDELARLLSSAIHEHRFAAVEILVVQYKAAEPARREEIVSFYLRHAHRMNNWDLVDASAPYLLGEHLKGRPRDLLDALVVSDNLWERRIAMVATLALVRHGETKDTFRIAKKLLPDEHDLIHKAVGWALREAGKISPSALLLFLRKHYGSIPRTTLRYAIERFPVSERRQMLKGVFLDRDNAALRNLGRKAKKVRAPR